MSKHDHDIVGVGDFRFPGGAATGPAEHIRAQAKAGYRTALIQVKAPILHYPHPINPRVRACIDEGLADLLPPETLVSATLVQAYHPQLFTYPPHRPLRVTAEHKLFVISHPPLDGEGQPFYDWTAIDANVQEALGDGVLWAPLGPAVRVQLTNLPDRPPLFDRDWLDVIDVDTWHVPDRQPLGPRPIIGRHSRPDPLKWPDDAETMLAAYPDDPRFAVRILGGGPFLEEILGRVPANWDIRPFNGESPEGFLAGIDFFVYFHSRRWVEAFGRVIIEAMASGSVTILPPYFDALCGEGAIYREPSNVRDTVLALHADSEAFRRQADRGTQVVRDRFSHEAHIHRLKDLIGPPRSSSTVTPMAAAAATSKKPRRVLFVTSNGVGMGHLARTLAIARRCDATVAPVFVTMSQAMRVVEEQGYLAEFLPFHAYLGGDLVQWNHYLRHELSEMINFYDAPVLVFDGNVAYGGLVAALRDNPACFGIWCRRAMWRPGGAAESNIQRETAFHAVIEPGELAASYDAGLTVDFRGRTRLLDPIRMLDNEALLDRDAAPIRAWPR